MKEPKEGAWAQSKSAQIIEMFRPLQEAFQPLIDSIAQIWAELGLTGDGGDFLTTVFNGLATVINYLSPVLKVAAAALGAIAVKFAHLMEAIGQFIATSPRLQKFFAGLWAGAVTVFTEIVKAAVKAFGGLSDIIEGVFTLNWGKLKNGLTQSLHALADGGGIAEKAGAAFGDGYQKGFKKSTLFDVAAGKGAGSESGPAALMKGKTPAVASLAPTLKDKAGTAGANGGSKVTNINLHIGTLIKDLNVTAANVTESAEQIGQLVLQHLMSSLNDVNTLSSAN